MSSRKPVEILVKPWFKDHCFNGKVILPAVEIMEILASAVQAIRPDILPWTMCDATFSKFLEIPAGATELSALIEYDGGDKGEICARLVSQIHFKKISRIKEHAQITFLTHLPETADLAATDLSFPTQASNSVTAEQIYMDLVPFGPVYHTLTGHLHLSERGAWGTLLAPLLTGDKQTEKTLGSPFPLDGAMHAACVFGQCVTDFVPFPVGFRERLILNPTRAGEQYKTSVIPVSQSSNELVFDLFIVDTAGTLCETLTGLRMRDVSAGLITPPAWIRNNGFANS
ncbi:MAG: polyketide synthase dehydratase domain-containing protein [Proteobacteria bacterium]|nr:polyketide synthase dehydratase domain-containing protein [Pseudomonadota bacterium]MBU1456743.1 polyketide synthase dehydratase domain-containing protein [Pseudomonadota bacterium]